MLPLYAHSQKRQIHSFKEIQIIKSYKVQTKEKAVDKKSPQNSPKEVLKKIYSINTMLLFKSLPLAPPKIQTDQKNFPFTFQNLKVSPKSGEEAEELGIIEKYKDLTIFKNSIGNAESTLKKTESPQHMDQIEFPATFPGNPVDSLLKSTIDKREYVRRIFADVRNNKKIRQNSQKKKPKQHFKGKKDAFFKKSIVCWSLLFPIFKGKSKIPN